MSSSSSNVTSSNPVPSPTRPFAPPPPSDPTRTDVTSGLAQIALSIFSSSTTHKTEQTTTSSNQNGNCIII